MAFKCTRVFAIILVFMAVSSIHKVKANEIKDDDDFLSWNDSKEKKHDQPKIAGKFSGKPNYNPGRPGGGGGNFNNNGR